MILCVLRILGITVYSAGSKKLTVEQLAGREPLLPGRTSIFS